MNNHQLTIQDVEDENTSMQSQIRDLYNRVQVLEDFVKSFTQPAKPTSLLQELHV